MKSSKSLKKEEQEESSSLGCNDSATANLVGMDSIVMDKWKSFRKEEQEELNSLKMA